MRELPFFPPDQFDTTDRAALQELIYRIGIDPEQRFILGESTRRFERLLRDHLGTADVIACGSGTSALTLVLRAMDVGAGDEVIVPAFGCAPLAAGVVNLGATPVFADIREHTMVMDPDHAESLIGPCTKAVVPAHMFSVMADMPRYRAIADRYGIRLLEDSAVAQGGTLLGRPAGTWGDAGIFSFVQVKTFGTAGEGGAVVTADQELGETVRMLRNHGQSPRQRFLHQRIGYNSRFDEIQAAFQIHRFPGLAERLERRATIAEYYTRRFTPLASSGGVLPPPPGRDGRCYYVYSLLAERRDELQEYLASRGIHTHVYYRKPLPFQRAFRAYTHPGARWPRAEDACARILALPLYPQLTGYEVNHIADAVCDFQEETEQCDDAKGTLP